MHYTPLTLAFGPLTVPINLLRDTKVLALFSRTLDVLSPREGAIERGTQVHYCWICLNLDFPNNPRDYCGDSSLGEHDDVGIGNCEI